MLILIFCFTLLLLIVHHTLPFFSFFFFLRTLPSIHAQFLGKKSKETLVSCHLAAQVQTDGGGTTSSDRTCNPNCIQPGTDNFLRWKLLLTRGSGCHPRGYWRKLVTDQALLSQNHLQTALETICTQRTLTQVLIHRQLSTYPSLKCFLVQPQGFEMGSWVFISFYLRSSYICMPC